MAIYFNNLSNIKDRAFFERAFNCALYLFCGTDINCDIELIRKEIEDNIKSIDIISKDNDSFNVLSGKKGYCVSYVNDNTASLVMYGLKDCNDKEVLFEFMYECMHLFMSIMPKYKAVSPIGKLDDAKFLKKGVDGQIIYPSFEEKKFNSYGEMFSDCYAKLMAEIGLFVFDDLDFGINSVDEAIKINEDGSIFEDLTKLMIAACTNGNMSYQDLIENKEGIFEKNFNLESKVKLNDFMYGMICDPIYIQDKYDKVIGFDGYINLCSVLDKEYNYYKENGQYSENLKGVILTFIENIYSYIEFNIQSNLRTYYIKPCDELKLLNNFNEQIGEFCCKHSDVIGIEDVNNKLEAGYSRKKVLE